MDNENDDSYAFPYEVRNGAGEPVRDHYGMALRDYFAAKALPCALQTIMHDFSRDDPDWTWSDRVDNDLLAELAYSMADSMLKARK